MSQTGSAVPTWTLGWRLRRALAFADISVQEIADELGVTRTTVSRWANDRGTPPRRVYVKEWAARCGVPFEWLEKGDAAEDEAASAAASKSTASKKVNGGYLLVSGTSLAAHLQLRGMSWDHGQRKTTVTRRDAAGGMIVGAAA